MRDLIILDTPDINRILSIPTDEGVPSQVCVADYQWMSAREYLRAHTVLNPKWDGLLLLGPATIFVGGKLPAMPLSVNGMPGYILAHYHPVRGNIEDGSAIRELRWMLPIEGYVCNADLP